MRIFVKNTAPHGAFNVFNHTTDGLLGHFLIISEEALHGFGTGGIQVPGMGGQVLRPYFGT